MGVKGIRGKKKIIKKKFSHNELCFDLAEAKGTKFIEVPLGSVYLNKRGLGIADVITIKPSYNRFNLDIYECKVSRSDFLQDVKKGKFKKYLKHCNRLYFAVTKGLVKPEEVPDGVGLIVRGDNGWTTIKAAKKRDIVFEQQMMLSLLFFNGRVYDKRRRDISSITHLGYINNDKLKGFGVKIKKMIVGYNKLERTFFDLLRTLKRYHGFTDVDCEEWENKIYFKKNENGTKF